MTSTRRRLVTLLAAVFAVVASGCGGADSGPIAHPTDPGTVVFQVVDYVGGPRAFPDFERPASFSLYGDGRFIIADDPPVWTAVPALWSGRLHPEGIQRVLRGARDAGLLDPGADLGSSHLVDGSGTTFRFTVDNTQRSVGVYALVDSESSDIAHLPAEQRRLRERARALHADLRMVADWAAEELDEPPTVLEPDRVAVFAVQPEVDEDEWGPDPQVLPWPLGDLADLGDPVADWPPTRCLVVTGADLDAVLDAARKAPRESNDFTDFGSATRWETGSGPYLAWFRPLLPHETGCEDVPL